MHLILASASPRRAELLTAGGFTFEVVTTEVDEGIHDGEAADAYVRRLAADKSASALAMIGQNPAAAGSHVLHEPAVGPGLSRIDAVVVLGADTAVVADGEILGKPRDDDEARAMLKRLSGRRHDVLTGVSLRRGALEIGRVESTAVFFTALTDVEIAWYVSCGEGRDKAGAYAIQGLGSRFVWRIEGSYSNVVGLPLAVVYELFSRLAALPSVLASGG